MITTSSLLSHFYGIDYQQFWVQALWPSSLPTKAMHWGSTGLVTTRSVIARAQVRHIKHSYQKWCSCIFLHFCVDWLSWVLLHDSVTEKLLKLWFHFVKTILRDVIWENKIWKTLKIIQGKLKLHGISILVYLVYLYLATESGVC